MPILEREGSEIYYEVHGDGQPFLFCSVTGLDHQAWKFHQVPEFSRDHKVILFDYRGTGKSTKAIQKYSIKMFTDDAAAILKHLNVEQADRLRPLHGRRRGPAPDPRLSASSKETHSRLERRGPSRRPRHSPRHVP